MEEKMKFQIGYETINSYRRLAYTPWHALAEFVDNSTQAYFDNREALDLAFVEDGAEFEVAILYDRAAGRVEITDNSIGMDEGELEEALKVAAHAPRPHGRSKYGMGLKTISVLVR
jgi:HSP90 family molecular chaperone